MTEKIEDRREPMARTEIKEWNGLVLSVDAHSLPASVSPDTFNCASILTGSLSVRRGAAKVKFTET